MGRPGPLGDWCAKRESITCLTLLKCEYLVSFETLFSKRKMFSIQVLWQNVGETEGLCAILPNQTDWHPKADGASRHEREYFIVTSWGIEALLGKRCVHILLHCERKEWYTTFSLGIWNLRQGMEWGKFLLCAEEESESHSISTKLVTTTSYKLRIICLESGASGKQRDRVTGLVTLLMVGRITDKHISFQVFWIMTPCSQAVSSQHFPTFRVHTNPWTLIVYVYFPFS